MRKLCLGVVVSMVVMCGAPRGASASQITLSNVEIVSQDTTNDTATIQFDISWTLSWRDDSNYDAAWVFFKYCTSFGTNPNWQHVSLSAAGTNPTGFSTGSGTAIEIIVPADGAQEAKPGCFIQRSEEGSGTVNTTSIQVVWDYGVDGVSDATMSSVCLKGFAIEMVYIPAGSFYAGDTTSTYCFTEGSADTDPWYIESEEAIEVLDTSGDGYYYTSTGGEDDATGSEFWIPAEFPKGYEAFYIMKYELSQAQYRDFINSLVANEQANLVADDSTAEIYVMTGASTMTARDTLRLPPTAPTNAIAIGCDYASRGNGYDGDDKFNMTDDGEWIAFNYADWQILCSYADWAALRPITELEYEKACRGPSENYPVPGELAWGTSGSANDVTALNNEGEMNERSGTAADNSVYGSTYDGPARGGATTSTTGETRETAGSTYYGVMDMSGNLIEQCVTVGNSTGRGFQGTHGDGELLVTTNLSYLGNADVPDWPGYTGTTQGVDLTVGAGQRGGSWDRGDTYMCISDRQLAGTSVSSFNAGVGIRLGRTAPEE